MRFTLATLAILAACAQTPADEPASAPPSVLRFEMQTREMTYGDCVAGSESCTYVRLDYPTVVEAPPGTAVAAVTSAIDSFLAAPLHPDDPPAGVNALMARFLADFAEFKAAEPKSAQSWFLERKAFVLRSASNLLSLSFSERSYLGGAHGLGVVHYLNLDPATGAKKALVDLLREGALPEATRLAEAGFRETRGIAEGVSFADAGFTFENGTFVLTDNCALRDDGLACTYNAYDVAPYSMGATEIVLRTEEIRELLRPEYASQTGTTSAPQREQ